MGERCENCRWWSLDNLGDGWCVNSDSPNCGDATYPDDTCREFKPKDKTDGD
jgi:hypothetical protein